MNLFIFCHIGFITEVIEVTSISLRVKLWDERCTLRAKRVPINFSKVLICINILDVREPLALRCDAAVGSQLAHSDQLHLGLHTL